MNNRKNAPTNLTMPVYLFTFNNFRATEWIVIKSVIEGFYYFFFYTMCTFSNLFNIKNIKLIFNQNWTACWINNL